MYRRRVYTNIRFRVKKIKFDGLTKVIVYVIMPLVMNLKKIFNLKINGGLYCYISFVFCELILRAFTCRPFFTWGLLFIFIFSLIPAIFFSAVSRLVGKTARRVILKVMLATVFLLYSTQVVYHGFFGKYLIVFSLIIGGAAQIIESGLIENTLSAIISGIPAIILLSLPFVFSFVFAKKITYKKTDVKRGIVYMAGLVALCIALPVTISFIPTLKSLRSGSFDMNLSVREFGLFYTEALDIKYNLLGIEQDLVIENEKTQSGETSSGEEKPPEIDTSPNIININFNLLNEKETDKNLKTLNSYFASKSPTNKNKYTGMYEGYNLISITAEGFSPYAVHPDLTPTLYKMSQEGFKFTNFYTPIWGVSTSDGEYTACTGLIPKAGVWSFYRSGNNYMPFCLGNMFKSIGVNKTFAYHNNTYTYYHREISHPNMGYNYKGVGNGLLGISKVWPQSDLEMINSSMDEYLSDSSQFCTYYMTISGHLNYTRIGNSMAHKNWEAVKNLTCSENLKAYYACNIELDKAMEALLKRLNEEGVADKTVIAITPDHYPYGLEQDGADKYAIWRELLGHDVEPNFELYKSNFILYCQGTKDAPTIDKYSSSLDVLPTLLNLFGFEYDSRLLMGSDILSDSEQLVIFSDRSFITEKGMYNSSAKEFTLLEGVAPFATEAEEKEYIEQYKKMINNRFQVSAKILENDYYGYLFDK